MHRFPILAQPRKVAAWAGSSPGRQGVFSTVVDSLLGDGLGVRFRARGNSMHPTVRDGECLIVAPVAATRVAIGDVLLCRTRGRPIAHRVLSIELATDGSQRFNLRGDAVVDYDQPVSADQVQGKVVAVEREGKLVSLEVAGGRLGRFLLTSALRLRSAAPAAQARRLLAPLRRAYLSP